MKTAVYTASFGNIELFNPVVINSNVDYIYFTDSNIKSNVWQVRKVKRQFDNPRLESRYYLDQSTVVLPEYDITIMHGANAQLLIDPLELVDRFLCADIAAFKHPHRNCIYKEAIACKRMRKDSAGIIDTQMQLYKNICFPENYGLHACGLLIRRNTEQIKEFESLWFNEVKNYSSRDQLSFDYIRWVTGIEISDILGNIFHNQYIRINKH